MFHVKIIINIISRNHKTLRSCVAPSVSPGSISILSRQPKLHRSFVGSLRSFVLIVGTNSNFTFDEYKKAMHPLNIKGPIINPFIA